MRAIIVDDEPLGRERVRMLSETIEDLVICAECKGGHEAVRKIQELTPELVFLDIQMPQLDGFGVLTTLRETDTSLPEIVFITAYDQHAVKAFEVNAIDYLLKPIQKDRFQQAVARVRSRLEPAHKSSHPEQLLTLLQGIVPKQTPPPMRRLEVRSQGRIDYVSVDDIFWLEADGNYVNVHTRSRSQLARITLAELEASLPEGVFFRISRSAIVRLDRITALRADGRRDHRAELSNGAELPVTRSLQELQRRIQYTP